MVTMSTDKAGKCSRDGNGGVSKISHKEEPPSTHPSSVPEESPNHLLYKKRMQDEVTGVPVRTVKSFMSKIPSVFTGTDLIMWMVKNLDVEDQQEALHLAHLMAAHGYFFPIDDHMLTVKNDNTFYRFQTPYFWPSNCWEPENTDYAVYLCKRTMQNKTRLELADYEAENLARLQKMFSRKWEFIFMQAEAQSKVDKKRDKLERKVLDSQERAFWDVHRPMLGFFYKLSPSTSELAPHSTMKQLKKEIDNLKSRIDRRNIKVSKAADSFVTYYEQYLDYDSFFVQPEYSNPWISDTTEYWDQEKLVISTRRVKRWGFSLKELLKDPAGKEHFTQFLDKEFSGENLRYSSRLPTFFSQVQNKAIEIWTEFLSPDASCPINVDSYSSELTKKNMEVPDRWGFDCAANHVYQLMKNDSYSRYLRSEMYKEFLNGSKKKTRKR
nr:unnamed protein product [Callosobruchus analis]